jgi:hypothetical protein
LVIGLVGFVACGDDNKPAAPDAGPGGPDAPPSYPACREFPTVGYAIPAHVTGVVAGADIDSPSSCAAVDAPYGIESAGPDAVVRLDGLVAGTAYRVRLTSVSDLAFYVVTGCSTPTGPAAKQCLVFVDATAGSTEVGRFVADGASAFVVVDFWASHAPSNASFTVDAYAEACSVDAQCGAPTPVCQDGACVECSTSFDCASSAAPVCDDASFTCVAGASGCASDDPAEPGDDGPAGATVLVPDASGDAAASGQICSSPIGESDYVAFDVTTLGEVWDVSLAWTGTRDLDLQLSDHTGHTFGLSFWEHPEHVRLTYLALGRYYVRVSEFVTSANASPASYTLTAHRALGAGCTTAADCAGEYGNQIYRGSCLAGACIAIDGAATVAEGGACDSGGDCAAGLSCPSFYFVANADTRDVCARGCTGDADCAPLGGGEVCTTYLIDNFCVQPCTSDLQCPTAIGTQPASGPWARLTCDVPTGRCLP